MSFLPVNPGGHYTLFFSFVKETTVLFKEAGFFILGLVIPENGCILPDRRRKQRKTREIRSENEGPVRLHGQYMPQRHV
jgi:hypothetical protein